MSAKRGLRIRGLRQRWLVNAVLPIVLVVIAIVTVYTLGVRRTYYSAMRSGLETRARVAADNFSSYGLKSYSEYFRYASITAETFEEKDRVELRPDRRHAAGNERCDRGRRHRKAGELRGP